MRVLLLTPSVRPLGARRSLVELVRHLPDTVEPLVVCPAAEGIYHELKELGVSVGIAPQGAWRKATGRIIAITRQLPALWGIVGNFKPDLVHANEFHIIPQAVRCNGGILGPKKGAFPTTGHIRLGITPRQTINYDLARCQRLLTVSNAVKELFANTDLYERVRVVYNGVNVSEVTAEGARHPEVAQWRSTLEGDRPLVVGLFGLISERKNQLVAAQAVQRANALGANIALLLAGDAFKGSMEYGEKVEAALKSDDLKKKSLWLPFQKGVAELFRSIDINLLISSEEGFGRTIIEAAAAEKTSIGSRIGGIPELIQEGKTGWLTDEGDVEGLAQVLLQAWKNQDQLAAMGKTARAHTEAHFTIQAHVNRMLEVWNEAME